MFVRWEKQWSTFGKWGEKKMRATSPNGNELYKLWGEGEKETALGSALVDDSSIHATLIGPTPGRRLNGCCLVL